MVGSLLAAATAGSATFLALIGTGHTIREARPLLEELDRGAASIGLGLMQVTIAGNRNTPDREIYDSLDLPNVRSLVRFDSAAIAARISRLPWIEAVEIERVLPGRVDIRVSERKPSAIWLRSGREHLIDATGRELSAIPTGSVSDLPRVSGDGAAEQSAAILELAARYPEIWRRLDVAERVAGRRWTLRLAAGPAIHLPAERPEAALESLMTRPDVAQQTGPAVSEVDLRVHGRIIVLPASARGLDGARTAGRPPRVE